MTAIGEVVEREEFIVQWKIKNFFSLSSKTDTFYSSPLFSFANETWYIRIYPNGSKQDKSNGYIDLYLCRSSSGLPIRLEYSLSVETMGEKIFRDIEVFGNRRFASGCSQFLNKIKLLETKLSDTLSVVCKMKNVKPDEVSSKSFYAMHVY